RRLLVLRQGRRHDAGARRRIRRGSRGRQVPPREDARLMSSDDLFAAGEQVIAAAQAALDAGRFADRAGAKLYAELLKDYQKLFRTTRRLLRLSDRNEHQLNAMTEEQRKAN